jgi:ribosomal protein S6
MKYEVFYLIGASSEGDVEKIKTEIKDIIVLAGGVFEEKETHERRRLAYKVKHETHWIFIAQRFALEEPEKLKEVIKLNLYTGILRFIISRADELPELKTKEERTAQANRAAEVREPVAPAPAEEKAPAVVEAPKEVVAKEEPSAPEETEAPAEPVEKPKKDTKKKGASDEDIDKKLEEILNI